jgi:ferric-dicitrate binding protein FerR (iron transport regulator)
VLNNGTNGFTVRDVNTDLAVAWKNGLFRFKETNIREIMRQVERWYDVEVDFKAMGNDQDYTGIVPRTQNVSALLQMLELTGTVHFTVEGKKITVQP